MSEGDESKPNCTHQYFFTVKFWYLETWWAWGRAMVSELVGIRIPSMTGWNLHICSSILPLPEACCMPQACSRNTKLGFSKIPQVFWILSPGWGPGSCLGWFDKVFLLDLQQIVNTYMVCGGGDSREGSERILWKRFGALGVQDKSEGTKQKRLLW